MFNIQNENLNEQEQEIEIFYNSFNENKYVNTHTDLKNNIYFINNKKRCWLHFSNYGWKEFRNNCFNNKDLFELYLKYKIMKYSKNKNSNELENISLEYLNLLLPNNFNLSNYIEQNVHLKNLNEYKIKLDIIIKNNENNNFLSNFLNENKIDENKINDYKNSNTYLFNNYDWEEYINNNHDLLKAGINTPKKAFKHWIYYGKHENRKINIKNKNKEMDKDKQLEKNKINNFEIIDKNKTKNINIEFKFFYKNDYLIKNLNIKLPYNLYKQLYVKYNNSNNEDLNNNIIKININDFNICEYIFYLYWNGKNNKLVSILINLIDLEKNIIVNNKN